MEFTAENIAAFLNGKIEGDPQVKVHTVAKIEEGKPGSLAFLANPKYTHYIYSTKASIVLVNQGFVAEKEITATLIRVPDAYQAFAALLEMYAQSTQKIQTGISPNAQIDPSAKTGENVYIGAYVYIGKNTSLGNNVKIHPNVTVGDKVSIGDNTIIYSGATIYNDSILGKDCIIHSGAVIGSDGFGFAPMDGIDYKKIPQLGNVLIEDKVEIGANTTIDRATIGSTIIRRGVKLDNLIQVAHNVEIGENTVIAAQTGISGSSKIGKNCMIGGQVGISGHISIADGVKIGAQAGILSSVTLEGATIIGSPAIDMKAFFKSSAVFKELPAMRHQIIQLKKEIENLKQKK